MAVIDVDRLKAGDLVIRQSQISDMIIFILITGINERGADEETINNVVVYSGLGVNSDIRFRH